MNPDVAWPVLVFGIAVIWIAVTALYEHRRRRQTRRGPTWFERDMRYRQRQDEIDASKAIGYRGTRR